MLSICRFIKLPICGTVDFEVQSLSPQSADSFFFVEWTRQRHVKQRCTVQGALLQHSGGNTAQPCCATQRINVNVRKSHLQDSISIKVYFWLFKKKCNKILIKFYKVENLKYGLSGNRKHNVVFFCPCAFAYYQNNTFF